MSEHEQRYVPAAGRVGLMRLYDPIMALTMRERIWRAPLLRRVDDGLPPGGTAVDVGAGTGSFAIALAAKRPDVRVIAVDGDAEALALARAKPGAGAVDWSRALAGGLPIGDGQADAVVMSLLLHHLAPCAKRAALVEARRVLAGRGLLHVADWGRPAGLVPRSGFLGLRLIDGFDGTRDHAAGRLPGLIGAARFREPTVWMRVPTAWGTLELMTARPRPAG